MVVRKNKGFTLVEIMIVITIIGILAAVSIPAILRSRMNANENVARSNLRVVRDAIESYRMTQMPGLDYPPDLPTLAAITPSLLDSNLANATAAPGKQGYFYTYTPVSRSQFTLTATPDEVNVTGANTYFVDETGIIRVDDANGDPIE